eukprot:Pgem_evm1s10338
MLSKNINIKKQQKEKLRKTKLLEDKNLKAQNFSTAIIEIRQELYSQCQNVSQQYWDYLGSLNDYKQIIKSVTDIGLGAIFDDKQKNKIITLYGEIQALQLQLFSEEINSSFHSLSTARKEKIKSLIDLIKQEYGHKKDDLVTLLSYCYDMDQAINSVVSYLGDNNNFDTNTDADK